VPEDQELCAQAERFAGLFRAIYLTFHRRDGPRNELSGASRAVLQPPAWREHPRVVSRS